MSLDLLGVLVPLLLAGLMILASGRPRQLTLEGLLIWGAASIAWAQVLPRIATPEGVFPAAVWLTVFLALWLLGRPRIHLLRMRWSWFLGFLALIVGSAVAIGLPSTSALMQVLGWGHDNSAHIVLTRANAECGGFLFACGGQTPSVPSYLIEYPQGFSVAWASFPGAFGGSDFLSSLGPYALIYLLTSMGVLALAAALSATLVSRGPRWLAGGLTVLVLAMGVWSHQFWSGFASFLWAIVLLLAFIVLRETGLLSPNSYWFAFAGVAVIATYYTHQLLAPFIAVYLLADGWAHRRELTAAARDQILVPILVGISFLSLLALAPRSAQGSTFLEQVLVEAGMESIPLWVWVPLLVIGTFPLFARISSERFALRWAVLANFALFGFLAALTLKNLGYVSYYPMKLLTFLVLILVACSAAVVVAKPLQTRANQLWFTLGGLAVLGLAVLPPLLRSPGFKTAYQGSTPTVLRTIAADFYGGGVGLCAPFVFNALDALPSGTARVEVYRDGQLLPLEGRWISSIRGTWDTNAWINEVPWRPLEDIPEGNEPGAVLLHNGTATLTLPTLVLKLGEPCSREPLPAVLAIG